jgi:hypothetical protein
MSSAGAPHQPDPGQAVQGPDDKLRAEMRDYAWKYFSTHADQRLKAFNFFLTLYTFAFGGLILLVKEAHSLLLGGVAGLLLSFLAFIFWKLDVRNKELIAHGEAALKHLEADARLPDGSPGLHPTKVFSCAENTTDRVKAERKIVWHNPRTWWTGHYTYSTCFRALQFTHDTSFWSISSIRPLTFFPFVFSAAPASSVCCRANGGA